MRIRIQPYKRGSASARELSRALNVKRVSMIRTRFRPRYGDVVINWGSSEEKFPNDCYLNPPCRVVHAQNKLTAYALMHDAGVPVPPFTQDSIEADDWLSEGKVVVARHLLRATQGRGIELVHPNEVLPVAPLYTQYVKKRDEYRIHVAGMRIIDVQQKRRRRDVEERNNQVRNHHNGWVFCRNEIAAPPECVWRAAKRAVHALGLDFGAVDVGYNAHYDSACVYEVNTAPGLEGTTLQRYTSWFIDVLYGEC